MLIGELSRRTGVGTHLLRYYEDQGLLEPGRGANGYREYSDDAILTVTQIRRLLEAGLSTEEIGFMLPCATGTAPELEPCPELLDTLRARLQGLDERIDTLTRSRQALHDYIDATERRVSPHYRQCDPTTPKPTPVRSHSWRFTRMQSGSDRG
ncbi:DNA-binding transcriptional MerR regulator [Nonomuraea polychroma]|uniref:DNA-binding transcriptional MerR regulator n=1 Tax=Nonomuraea polychroma TaxID=46176 RepID=A0A438MKE8_9ACTN|nr:MerR family transcriptional regulator [Nonomuraea polychroma]RVX46065.1 DNA-binding transcriptional MerR regulator [Nonomuraea polychroma]